MGRLCGIVAFAASSAIALFGSWPEPRIHDEFSYLLAADTFSRGRVTNPPHQLWQHFETFHVNQAPTYCSIYPPAQGMFLTLGQVIYHPIVGVWLSAGLACAAICWMLQAFMRPTWALMGGVLAILVVVFSGPTSFPGYWSQSYWGGAVAAFAGALVFGAFRRLQRQPKVKYSLLLGLGLTILANSRPFEGFVVSLPVAVGLFGWMLSKKGPPLAISLKQVFLPMVLLGTTTLGAMAVYNWQTTANPLCSPYQLNCATYAITPHVPHFFWQSLGADRTYNNAEMHDFYVHWVRAVYHQNQSAWMDMTLLKLTVLWEFYIGWVLLLPLAFSLVFLAKNRWTRFALLTCALLLIAVLQLNFVFPHYFAPATGLVILLSVQSLRYSRLLLRRFRSLFVRLPFYIILLYASIQMLFFFDSMNNPVESWHRERAEFVRQRQNDGRKHLLAVKYCPGHSVHREWVYNAADIDQAQVVWARLMPDPEKNRRLFEYFKERKIWILEIGSGIRRFNVQEYP